jgi:UDPglucose 6-dehydrogenase
VKLITAVKESTDEHKGWARRKLAELLGNLNGRRISVLGMTYKPGTDTLRRSSSVELCVWLAGQGAKIRAHDPAVKKLPEGLASSVTLCATPGEAMEGAEALVIATEWPEYRNLGAEEVVSIMASPVVVDPNRFLSETLGSDSRMVYAAVGTASRRPREGGECPSST